jgi:hypothetical protein
MVDLPAVFRSGGVLASSNEIPSLAARALIRVKPRRAQRDISAPIETVLTAGLYFSNG